VQPIKVIVPGNEVWTQLLLAQAAAAALCDITAKLIKMVPAASGSQSGRWQSLGCALAFYLRNKRIKWNSLMHAHA
jgi:hypothetical protein